MSCAAWELDYEPQLLLIGSSVVDCGMRNKQRKENLFWRPWCEASGFIGVVWLVNDSFSVVLV
jgi:hypothetical protein